MINNVGFDYIDCVSSVQHIHNLRKELKSISSQEMELAFDSFVRCYYTNYSASRCGRHVILRTVLLDNINTVIDNYKNKIAWPYLSRMIESAMKGIWDNCALGQGDGYYPNEQ